MPEEPFDNSISAVPIELRAALSSILVLARRIRDYDGAMDAETREYATYIRANAEHMSAMLNGLRRAPDSGQRSRKDRPPCEIEVPG